MVMDKEIIMKKITISSLIISILTLIVSNTSNAMIVFDPTNFAKNSITAEQTFQTAENTLNTYNETVNSYEQLVQQYNLSVTNLRDLANINELITNLGQSVNNYYGTSPMSQLASLNSTSPTYIEQRNSILAQYFEQPTSTATIQAEFGSALNSDQIKQMQATAQLQNLNYQLLEDSIDESTHQQTMATQRAQAIANYGQTLKGLGANSELQTEQTTASELNFSLQQNEQLIQEINELLKYTRMQQAEDDSEIVQQSQAEQTSLQKSLNQGTTGLGRNSWGNF